MKDKTSDQKKILQQRIKLLALTYQNFVIQMDQLAQEKNETINKILKDIDQNRISHTLKKIKDL